MSHKKASKARKFVKCAYCGRDNVPVNVATPENKTYMAPHVKPQGGPCFGRNIPAKSDIREGKQ
jgi:hypothetical protein